MPETAPELALSVDSLFDLLSDWRRRRVLWHLDTSDGPSSVADLAEMLAADSNSEVGSDRIQVTLHHSILPRLSTEGFVDYDRENRSVSLTESGGQLRPYLEFARAFDAAFDD